MVFFESNHWFKDLDLFSSWCTFGDMAPKLNFAMKSPMKVMKAPKAKCKAKAKAKADPKPKADAKAKAKVKAEPPESPEQKTPDITDVEVSRQDQQLLNTFLSRSDDPRAESLRALYHGMARMDPKKKELVAQWKLDKTLSWHVHQADSNCWLDDKVEISFLHILILCFFGDKRGRKDTPCRLNVQYQGGNDFFWQRDCMFNTP